MGNHAQLDTDKQRRDNRTNTNLLPETLSEKYSPAVASRLLGEFLPLRFFGDDIRLLKMRRT